MVGVGIFCCSLQQHYAKRNRLQRDDRCVARCSLYGERKADATHVTTNIVTSTGSRLGRQFDFGVGAGQATLGDDV